MTPRSHIAELEDADRTALAHGDEALMWYDHATGLTSTTVVPAWLNREIIALVDENKALRSQRGIVARFRAWWDGK